MRQQYLQFMLLICAAFFLGGCEPEVGTEQWCLKMQEKEKSDWSANEAGDFAQHCLFKFQK